MLCRRLFFGVRDLCADPSRIAVPSSNMRGEVSYHRVGGALASECGPFLRMDNVWLECDLDHLRIMNYWIMTIGFKVYLTYDRGTRAGMSRLTAPVKVFHTKVHVWDYEKIKRCLCGISPSGTSW